MFTWQCSPLLTSSSSVSLSDVRKTLTGVWESWNPKPEGPNLYGPSQRLQFSVLRPLRSHNTNQCLHGRSTSGTFTESDPRGLYFLSPIQIHFIPEHLVPYPYPFQPNQRERERWRPHRRHTEGHLKVYHQEVRAPTKAHSCSDPSETTSVVADPVLRVTTTDHGSTSKRHGRRRESRGPRGRGPGGMRTRTLLPTLRGKWLDI